MPKENSRRIYPMSCHHGEGVYHDCDYVDRRNALIPSAERLATKRVMALPAETCSDPNRKHWALWSKFFIEAMDELWTSRTAHTPAA